MYSHNSKLTKIPVLDSVFKTNAVIPVDRVFKLDKNGNELQGEIDYSHVGSQLEALAANILCKYNVILNTAKGADFIIDSNNVEFKSREYTSETHHTICNGKLETMLNPKWINSTFKEKLDCQYRVDYVVNDPRSVRIVVGKLYDFSTQHEVVKDRYDDLTVQVLTDLFNGNLNNVTKTKTYSANGLIFEVYNTNAKSENVNGKWRITNNYMKTLKDNVLSSKIKQKLFV